LHEQDFDPMIVFELNVKGADYFIEETALQLG
jgi:hypothetical protein